MNISAKTEYGCIAVLALADSYGTGRPVRIRTIADAHGIPSRFLVQILLQLKSAGLVNSIRGAAGGYQLAKDPAAITLADVMEVIEGTMTDPVMSAAHETSLTKTLLSTWQQVSQKQRQMLSEVTFADLLEQSRSLSENMYYI